MNKNLPSALTSYDFLKTAAIILMLVDHIGMFFYPENSWWRVFGRMCVPMWFFLIGYARSRDTGTSLWVGAGIIVAANIVAGDTIFPLNILATILAVRLIFDPLVNICKIFSLGFWGISVAMLSLSIITDTYMEYGTIGFILAMCGYLIRQAHDGDISPTHIQVYFLFAFLGFTITQNMFFGLPSIQSNVMSAGLLAVISALYFFKPLVFKNLTKKLPRPLTRVIQFTGRRTLEVYVVHLVILNAIAVIFGMHHFGWFTWTWM